MEFATGALGALLPKLSMLLHGEYNLEKGVRGDIQRVMSKLERVHAALRHVGEVPVPLEQIIRPGIVNMWARDVGELSYDMEDFVDTFLVRCWYYCSYRQNLVLSSHNCSELHQGHGPCRHR